MGNPTPKLLVITRIDDGCISIFWFLDPLQKTFTCDYFFVPNQQWIYSAYLLFSWGLKNLIFATFLATCLFWSSVYRASSFGYLFWDESDSWFRLGLFHYWKDENLLLFRCLLILAINKFDNEHGY